MYVTTTLFARTFLQNKYNPTAIKRQIHNIILVDPGEVSRSNISLDNFGLQIVDKGYTSFCFHYICLKDVTFIRSFIAL